MKIEVKKPGIDFEKLLEKSRIERAIANGKINDVDTYIAIKNEIQRLQLRFATLDRLAQEYDSEIPF